MHFPIWAGAHDCRDTMAAAPSFLATLLAVAAAPAPPLTATTLQVDDGTSLIHRQQQKQPSTTAESRAATTSVSSSTVTVPEPPYCDVCLPWCHAYPCKIRCTETCPSTPEERLKASWQANWKPQRPTPADIRLAMAEAMYDLEEAQRARHV